MDFESFHSKSLHFKFPDTPGVCEGNITISKVTEDSCTLSWKPPVEDGGDEVTHYIVERRDTNRLNWVIVHAECKKLNCNITRLFKNTEYLFRVRGVNKYGPGVYLQSEPMVARNTFSKLSTTYCCTQFYAFFTSINMQCSVSEQRIIQLSYIPGKQIVGND